MKLLFKRDPEKGREAARAALAAAEAQIVELRRERAAKLVETDGIEDVQAIDRRIEEQRRAAQIHRDRIVLLDGECRAQAAERRERKREAAVKVIERKLADREALALKLEESIKRTGDLYFELIGSASISQDWPFREPSPRFGFIDIDGVKRELGWALFSAGRPIGGRSLLPAGDQRGPWRDWHQPGRDCRARRRTIALTVAAAPRNAARRGRRRSGGRERTQPRPGRTGDELEASHDRHTERQSTDDS